MNQWRAVLLMVLILAAAGPPSRAQGAASFKDCLRAIRDAQSKKITTGFMVRSIEPDGILARHNPDQALVPASNMKLLTSGASLLALGTDHEVYTDLFYHGVLADSVLIGNLRLRGEGDPTLVSNGTDSAPQRMAKRVAERGIKSIRGDLLVDDRLFKGPRVGPSWPLSRPTARWVAEVAALSLDHGTVLVTVRGASKAGRAPTVSIRPRGTGLRVIMKAVTVSSGKNSSARAERTKDPLELVVRGQLPQNRTQSFQVAVEDPAMIFGRVLGHALKSEGIVLGGQVRRIGKDEIGGGGKIIMRLATPVRDILPVLLKQSQNHRAEMLFKHLGAARGGGGTFLGGGKAVRAAFRLAGAELKGVEIKDGSGLSRDNRLTARALTGALLAMWRSRHRETWLSSLAHGGDGTLKSRLRDLGQRVQAKTGTLKRVSALSGYVKTDSGSTLIFSILNQGGALTTMRKLQDRLVRMLATAGSRR